MMIVTMKLSLLTLSLSVVLTNAFAPLVTHKVSEFRHAPRIQIRPPPSSPMPAALWMAPSNITGFAGATTSNPTLRRRVDKANNGATTRLDRTDSRVMSTEQECLLQIDGKLYNLTSWAKAHPGGVKVLRKFHNRDASKAFHGAAHSRAAYNMLKRFEIPNANGESTMPGMDVESLTTTTAVGQKKRPRWLQKLFTKEDPIGLHKYMGMFVLLNFSYRFGKMYFGDMTAGFGSSTKSILPVLTLIPHGLLSMSSLIFHTVPRERVVGKPMIWQEYRVHNIAFGMRSVVCGFWAWLAVHKPTCRSLSVVGSVVTAVVAMLVADMGTRRYQPTETSSTTATMPYWEGCSKQTQKRFKLFYAYCQFMATLACIAVANPIWPLSVLLAIQMASLLMTLVRKGIITAKGYHIGYTITLIMPYFVGFRNGFVMGHWVFPSMLGLGAAMFSLRRHGVNKFAIWLPVFVGRLLVGDRFIPTNVW